MPFAFDFAARSHVGMVRSNNQDSGYAGPHLLAMADGMGGHAGGDIASSVVIGSLVDLDDSALSGAEAGAALLGAIRSANDELAALTAERPDLEGMGTTLIAILRSRNKLVLAHIGDSRAFLARAGAVTQITKDHSYVQSLVDEGRISEEEAMTHPQRSLVTRVLTGRPEDEPDLVVREARAGDRYLIASDGLTDYVAEDTIRELLMEPGDPGRVADTLVDLALRAGAPDNVTVVVGDVVDLTKARMPSTNPQVVGSAALRRKGTRPIPVTPAEKAAALSQETRDDVPDDDEPDEVALAEQGPRSASVTWLRRFGVLGLAILVLGGGAYAAYAWTQQQYYVGIADQNVAIYRGINQDIGPVHLSRVLSATEVSIADLPDRTVETLREGASRPDESAAGALVDELRLQAVDCRAAKARGETCQVGVTPTPTTDSPTTDGTTTTTGSATSSGEVTPTSAVAAS